MGESQAIDPVCGMTIETEGAITREYDGSIYYLCSELCADRFDSDGEAYVAVSRLRLEGWGQTPRPGFLME